MDKSTKNKNNKIIGKISAMLMAGIIMIYSLLPIINPTTAKAASNNLQYKSIDTQIISKCWNNVPQSQIDTEVALLKSLGANYIAIGTPYDRPDEMAKWTTSIHNAGLNVWFRSH